MWLLDLRVAITRILEHLPTAYYRSTCSYLQRVDLSSTYCSSAIVLGYLLHVGIRILAYAIKRYYSNSDTYSNSTALSRYSNGSYSVAQSTGTSSTAVPPILCVCMLAVSNLLTCLPTMTETRRLTPLQRDTCLTLAMVGLTNRLRNSGAAAAAACSPAAIRWGSGVQGGCRVRL